MAKLPKGFKSDINIHLGKFGFDRRLEILDGISNDNTFLPRGIDIEDHDQTFVDFITSDDRMSISIDGKKTPIIFLTIQRWSEFSKTWQHSDKYKDVELPFITIVRKPDIQVGTNQASLWNIPGNRTYTYYKIPTWDGVRKGIDLYKIPQPTPVDITYEVRLFSNRMKDLNKVNMKIQRAFKSRQCYINVKGHPIPAHLENITDESNIDDFQGNRFYVQLFEIKLLGYILDEEDFEVVPTLNRTMIMTELIEEKIYKNVVLDKNVESGKATFTFVFKPESEPQFSFTSQYDLNFTQLIGIENIIRIVITINGVGIFDGLVMNSPIIISANDIVGIRIYKPFYTTGKFQLIGNG